jgi:adenosylhomocysteine nucleosidase
VVVAEKIVEHDFKSQFQKQVTHAVHMENVDLIRKQAPLDRLRVHFGSIASGDEDIVSAQRRLEVHNQTQALAAAWEGAGGARACRFFKKHYTEIRGISDTASQPLEPKAFVESLPKALKNAIEVTLTLLKSI